jgi:hypothetical protein
MEGVLQQIQQLNEEIKPPNTLFKRFLTAMGLYGILHSPLFTGPKVAAEEGKLPQLYASGLFLRQNQMGFETEDLLVTINFPPIMEHKSIEQMVHEQGRTPDVTLGSVFLVSVSMLGEDRAANELSVLIVDKTVTGVKQRKTELRGADVAPDISHIYAITPKIHRMAALMQQVQDQKMQSLPQQPHSSEGL